MADIPNEKKPDLSVMFDLSRDKAVKSYVDQFENLLRQQAALRDDIRDVSGAARDHMFSPAEIRAMKTIAKWRMDDKIAGAMNQFAALRRVSNAVGADLFDWADGQ